MSSAVIREVAAGLSELGEKYRYRRPEVAEACEKLALLVESETRSAWGLSTLPRGACIEAILYLRAMALDARRNAEYELAERLSSLEEDLCGLVD